MTTSTNEPNSPVPNRAKPATAFPRAAGVLLHPTSLPSRYGIGDVGAGARAFVDWLAAAGCTRWQILPLVPPGGGYSPYASLSSLAGNPLLIDLDDLVARGALSRADVEPNPPFHKDTVEWGRVVPAKMRLVERACEALRNTDSGQQLMRDFRARAPWVDDDALFVALRGRHQLRPWWDWPAGEKNRDPAALDRARAELAPQIERRVIEQALFDQQWHALKDYAASKSVSFIGDIPIYVADDSVDVWAHRHLFQLNDHGQPTHVAGCPPDAFSETGQWWGSPLYRWDAMKAEGHKWWIARLKRNLELTQVVRIDHFRGFAGYWSIPADAEDARAGRWMPGPGQALFDDLVAALAPTFGKNGRLPVIAEDLGVITADVTALREHVGLPGMKILQFAFGAGHDNAYLPHAHVENCVVYTGTHDNDTTLGWWTSLDDKTRDHVRRYLARDGSDIVWDLIRVAFLSPAHTAVVPFQDILALDSGARLNTPGLTDGNWAWRVRAEAFHPNLSTRLRDLVELGNRLPEVRARA
jgi:4-alpha-glucanotransferase